MSAMDRFTSNTYEWTSNMFSKMRRAKTLGVHSEMMETQLQRCLSTFDIILLGIGHMVGSGVYVLTASVAKDIAGPAIVLAFIISGFASLLAALCYSEFSVRYPRAGSAYSYTYLALGEWWAFIVGWNMILENVIGTAAVSRACSAYIDSLTGGAIRNYTLGKVSDSIGLNALSEHVDLFAFIIVIAFMALLTTGVRVTTYLNNLFSMVNIGVIILILVVGVYYADFKNWFEVKGGFMPYGWKGVFGASAACFYAYIGFDSIATSGEEAKDPQKSIPLATFTSMGFATLAYVGVSAVLTLMVPYNEINNESGLPDAIGSHGAHWAKIVVIVGACCGMVTVLIGTMYSLTRIVYAMADDGLLFAWMGRVNEKTQIPLYAMYFFSSLGACLALVLDITTLVEMMSISTLLAYLVVSASVIVVRYQVDEPMHQSLSADFNNQELNDLSADTPPDDRNLLNHSKRSASYQFQSLKDLFGKRDLLQLKMRQNEPGNIITACVFSMTAILFILCSLGPALIEDSEHSNFCLSIVILLVILLVALFVIIALHEQNTASLRYKVPLVPLIPTLSIAFNAALMTNLQSLTWYRLLVWLIAGIIVYFGYGIKHSRLDPESTRVKSLNIRNWGSVDDNACLPDNASVTSSAY